jgi:hypothetical protein
LSLLLIPLLLSLRVSADSIDPPDIHSQTLFEYAYGEGADSMEDRIRLSQYVDSLEAECIRLADSIEVLVGNVENMPERFRESHEVFMESVQLSASFAEDIQWFDLETGEAYWGSGIGYTYAHMTASLLWDRIQFYRYFLEVADEDLFGEFPYSDSRTVGGKQKKFIRTSGNILSCLPQFKPGGESTGEIRCKLRSQHGVFIHTSADRFLEEVISTLNHDY